MSVCPTLPAGTHFEVTTIHAPPFIDTGFDSGALLPPAEWTGYIVDSMQWISAHAGFTYTLQVPSGEGEACTGSEPLEFAIQYNCGFEDVAFLNKTDLYWGLYYISMERMQSALVTTPFLVDSGVVLVVPAERTGLLAAAKQILRPFTGRLWVATIFTLIFVASVMWLVEHPWQGGGYLAPKFLLSHVEQGFLSLMSHHAQAPVTYSGALLSMVWCFFAVLWIACYTAMLTATLTEPQRTGGVESIADMVEQQKLGRAGSLCVMAGTAQAIWLAESFPGIILEHVSGSTHDLVVSMRAGRCVGFIDDNSFAEVLVHSPQYCDEPLHIVGQPLRFGLQDMAIGVRSDLAAVRDVLSCWVQALRQCSPDAPGSVCYNGRNFAQLFVKWVLRANCATTTEYQLDVENFAFVLAVLWGLGLVYIFAALGGEQMRARLDAALHGHRNILDLLRSTHPYCFAKQDDEHIEAGAATTSFDLEQFVSVWRVSRATRAQVAPYLSRYLIVTDAPAWRAFRASEHKMALEQKWEEGRRSQLMSFWLAKVARGGAAGYGTQRESRHSAAARASGAHNRRSRASSSEARTPVDRKPNTWSGGRVFNNRVEPCGQPPAGRTTPSADTADAAGSDAGDFDTIVAASPAAAPALSSGLNSEALECKAPPVPRPPHHAFGPRHSSLPASVLPANSGSGRTSVDTTKSCGGRSADAEDDAEAQLSETACRLLDEQEALLRRMITTSIDRLHWLQVTEHSRNEEAAPLHSFKHGQIVRGGTGSCQPSSRTIVGKSAQFASDQLHGPLYPQRLTSSTTDPPLILQLFDGA